MDRGCTTVAQCPETFTRFPTPWKTKPCEPSHARADRTQGHRNRWWCMYTHTDSRASMGPSIHPSKAVDLGVQNVLLFGYQVKDMALRVL